MKQVEYHAVIEKLLSKENTDVRQWRNFIGPTVVNRHEELVSLALLFIYFCFGRSKSDIKSLTACLYLSNKFPFPVPT